MPVASLLLADEVQNPAYRDAYGEERRNGVSAAVGRIGFDMGAGLMVVMAHGWVLRRRLGA